MKEENKKIDLSIVIPIHNEKENLFPVVEEVEATFGSWGRSYEVILVDDGSNDGSREIIAQLVSQKKNIRGIIFRRNFGQTAAMSAGFQNAHGNFIVPMDGDGQNDPRDIPAMIELLEKEGGDVVSGWRRKRQDPFVRSFFSRTANRWISWVSGVHLHDYGCTLKVYKAEILQEIRLYGEMHRLIPIFAVWVGARVLEKEVNHRPRTRGHSKYGLGRTFKVLVDLTTAKFMSAYMQKPAYVFGFTSMAMAFFSTLILSYVAIRKIFFLGEWLSPLIFIGLGGMGFSLILFLMGILAELIVRVYFELEGKKPYVIKEILE